MTWDYEDFTTAEWYFETARAYLESGILIYQQIGHVLPHTYHHARSAKFLCDHALELFLKATEYRRTNRLLAHMTWDSFTGSSLAYVPVGGFNSMQVFMKW